MATHNEFGSGGVSPGGTSAVDYTANVTASGGVVVQGQWLVTFRTRPVERIGPSLGLLVGGRVSVSLDRDPVPQ